MRRRGRIRKRRKRRVGKKRGRRGGRGAPPPVITLIIPAEICHPASRPPEIGFSTKHLQGFTVATCFSLLSSKGYLHFLVFYVDLLSPAFRIISTLEIVSSSYKTIFF